MTIQQIDDGIYHAPNADHISDALISRRALYRTIERIAGMTVPQFGVDCMGDKIRLPWPEPSVIYEHVLKAIKNFPSSEGEVTTTVDPTHAALCQSKYGDPCDCGGSTPSGGAADG